MRHEIEDLERERAGLFARPPAVAENLPLGFLDVDIAAAVDLGDYAGRIRGVLDAVLSLALSGSFEGESLPTDDIPTWFVQVSSWRGEGALDFAVAGRERYAQLRGTDGPWHVQDWLHRFDPDFDIRGWAWWDLTRVGESRLRIWVDCWGETHFPHLELLWLAYTCGARTISHPGLAKSSVWAGETTFVSHG
jgi:hypothetical protein